MNYLLILTLVFGFRGGASVTTQVMPNYGACEVAKNAFIDMNAEHSWARVGAVCVEFDAGKYGEGRDPTKPQDKEE